MVNNNHGRNILGEPVRCSCCMHKIVEKKKNYRFVHSHCWCCSIFGGLLRRDDFIDRFALDACEKVDAPTDELT